MSQEDNNDKEIKILIANTKHKKIQGEYEKYQLYCQVFCGYCLQKLNHKGCPQEKCPCYCYNQFDFTNIINNYVISESK